MREEENKKKEKLITVFSLMVLACLAVALVILGVKHMADTIWFPVVSGGFLGIFWLISDVLPVVWLDNLAGKTEEQRKAYLIYAVTDLASLGGLVYFLADMSSITGALIYALGTVTKRKFYGEFEGTAENPEDLDESEAPEETADLEEPESSNKPSGSDAPEK